MKFIILTTARTGSNLLLDLLGSHPSITTLGELYNLNSLNRSDLIAILQDPLQYLKNKMYSRLPHNNTTIGFKMFYYHATRQQLYANSYPDNNIANMHTNERQKILEFYNYIQHNYNLKAIERKLAAVWEHLKNDLRLRVIHLKRKNRLGTFLSLRRAYAIGQWSKSDGLFASLLKKPDSQ